MSNHATDSQNRGSRLCRYIRCSENQTSKTLSIFGTCPKTEGLKTLHITRSEHNKLTYLILEVFEEVLCEGSNGQQNLRNRKIDTVVLERRKGIGMLIDPTKYDTLKD